MSDDDTVLLIVNDPGDGTPFGHGGQGYRSWFDRRLGLWLLRAPMDAAEQFCLRAGCCIAPPELQAVDHE